MDDNVLIFCSRCPPAALKWPKINQNHLLKNNKITLEEGRVTHVTPKTSLYSLYTLKK